MRKLMLLRAAIVEALPELAASPENLTVFIEAGSVSCNYSASDSHQVAYTAMVVVQDFSSDIALLTTALVRWMKVEQAEFLLNPETAAELITFEAELLSNMTFDVLFRVKLNERVIVSPPAAPAWTPEPPAPELSSDVLLNQLFLNGELIAQSTHG